VLTSTDIPPGGEGKIEVTFDSNHKKGLQNKSITVESTDPRNPRASLRISAEVEVLFGFEEYNVNFGRIRKGQPVTKTVSLTVKDPIIMRAVELASSSQYITARLSKKPVTEKGRLSAEISGTPEMPVGRINATITARGPDRSKAEAFLQVMGTVLGNVDILPEFLHFSVGSAVNDPKSVKQVVKVVGTEDNKKLRLLGVKDVDQRLSFQIDTLIADRQYEISITPASSVLGARQNVSGVVTITTDDKEQPVTSVPYSIFFGP
jgi:hypothetical protein